MPKLVFIRKKKEKRMNLILSMVLIKMVLIYVFGKNIVMLKTIDDNFLLSSRNLKCKMLFMNQTKLNFIKLMCVFSNKLDKLTL